jgi:hypothetical protein
MKTLPAPVVSCLIAGRFILAASHTFAADAEVHWQNYLGFSTHGVSINVGEKVTIFNDDPDGSSIVITSNLAETNGDYFNLDLPAGTSNSHTCNTAGTFTFSSEHSEDGLVTVTVGSAGPILLGSPRMAGGQFLFDVTGLTPGRTNLVQTSTNLTDWISLETNIATGTSATSTNSTESRGRTYRLLQLP